ncbi:MAG: 3'(2'),5'-bisphosphate nucleotidase CysQ [Hyphomicrobium sp.]|jgi:3'(2'), 5'-bisphosphate nucleotidase
MKNLDHFALADALLPSVLKAARVEMHYFEAGVAIEKKADSSPVTAADREAEQILLDGLWAAASGVPVVAEESASAGQLPMPGTAFFLVDPLDGTREFTSHSGEFTINIGLVVGDRPVFGVIYAPVFQRLFVTIGPGHAVETHISPASCVTSLKDCALRQLKTRTPDPDALIVLESRSHRTPATEAYLRGFRVGSEKRSGSSLKFCLIAAGEADMYARLGPTMEWDTAAGQAILEAAGGAVTRLSGAPLTYGKVDVDYLNPHFVAWAGAPMQPRINVAPMA